MTEVLRSSTETSTSVKRAHIPRLEMHVTHACNLTCESCSHYSNYGNRGHLDLNTADRWLSNWSRRCDAGELVLLGGEPTIHPDLVQFIPLIRSHWPNTRILIITNGFFLSRHPLLPDTMARDGRTELSMSIHHNSIPYLQRIRPMIELAQSWRESHGIRVEIVRSYANWTRRYLGHGESMMPFEDGDPSASWNICPAKHCTQIFEGKLWKCAPLTYLKVLNQKIKLSSAWDRYLSYAPLSPDCTDEELVSFLAKEEEDVCSMCPATVRPFRLPDPTARTGAGE
jgi:hypothetical protein